MPTKTTIIIGQRFGKLVITAYLGMQGYRDDSRWQCVCDCGKTTVVRTGCLKVGRTKSCGCLRKEATRKHGMHQRSEYKIWAGMKCRCLKPSLPSYRRYGGRGITVCQAWRDSFAAFYADIGARPSMNHTLDRMDNDGNYSCGQCEQCRTNGWTANCRWATNREQNTNKRTNRLLTFQGRTLCLTEWAEIYHMKQNTLLCRLRYGWSVERALTEPIHVKT